MEREISLDPPERPYDWAGEDRDADRLADDPDCQLRAPLCPYCGRFRLPGCRQAVDRAADRAAAAHREAEAIRRRAELQRAWQMACRPFTNRMVRL